jgi:hypothetical protein
VLLGLGLQFVGIFLRPCTSAEAQTASEAPTSHPECCQDLPRKTALQAGAGSALVWALAFVLFVLLPGRAKGPQVASFPYALATIPLLGLFVACWARQLLRRL